jgi:hypothetical protein
MITVGHIKNAYIAEVAFCVDRSSSLGNPWHVPPWPRELAIKNFREYLVKCLKEDTRERIYFEKILAAARTKTVVLLCHCKPLPCHADVIKELLEERLKQENDTCC